MESGVGSVEAGECQVVNLSTLRYVIQRGVFYFVNISAKTKLAKPF